MPLLESLNEQLMDAFRNRIYKLCDAGDYAQAQRECLLFLNVSHGTTIVGGGILAAFTAHTAYQLTASESNDDWYSYFTNSNALSQIGTAGLVAITAGAAYIAANNKEEVLKMLSIVKYFNNVLKDVEIPAEYAALPMAWKLAYAGKWYELYLISDKILDGINQESYDFRKILLLYPSLSNAFPLTGEYRNKTILWLAAKAGKWEIVDNILATYQWIEQNINADHQNYNLDKLPAELELNVTPDGDDPDAGVSVLWLLAKAGLFLEATGTALHMGADASRTPDAGPDAGIPVMWLAAKEGSWGVVNKIIINVPYMGWAPQTGEFRNKTVLCLALEEFNKALTSNNKQRLSDFLGIMAVLLDRGAKISELANMNLLLIENEEHLDIFFKHAPLELIKLHIIKNNITAKQVIRHATADFSIIRFLVDNKKLEIVQKALSNNLEDEDLENIVSMMGGSDNRNIFMLSFFDLDDLKKIIKENFANELESLPILKELSKVQDSAILAEYFSESSHDKDEENDNYYEQLMCHISYEKLLDPVSLPNLASNKFFERANIEQWIISKAEKATNPLSPDKKITKESILELTLEQQKAVLTAVQAKVAEITNSSRPKPKPF